MNSILSDHDRHQLRKMVEAHNVEDNTEKIRSNQHSGEIRRCIRYITDTKLKFPELSKQQLEDEILKEAGFLFFHYFDIYNLVVKDVDTRILDQLLEVLGKIEVGECDQHEGSYLVGKYLKEMYVDDVLRRSARTDEEMSKPLPVADITWSQFKSTMQTHPSC
jgi:hypothetical protein